MAVLLYFTFNGISYLYRALGGNPLYCDCELKWLSDWIKKDFVESGIAICTGPASMTSKLLLTTPSNYFECNGRFAVISCSILNTVISVKRADTLLI